MQAYMHLAMKYITFSDTHIQKLSNDHVPTYVKKTYDNRVHLSKPVSFDPSIAKANGDNFIVSTRATLK